MTLYFSDREGGTPPRTTDQIDNAVWGGIYVLIAARLANNSFGYRFPDECPDGNGICGHNDQMLRLSIVAELRGLQWPLSPDVLPPTPTILDFLEFTALSIGTPIEGYFHSFFRHHHLTFDHDKGLASFAAEVNALFERNGVAYEMSDDGRFRRIAPVGLHDVLAATIFRTGDVETDRLLEAARRQILSTDEEKRRDALEKLWDAFERLKTLEVGMDKRAQAEALLDKAMPPPLRFRDLLGGEAVSLTQIGNNYRIRHSETTQEILAHLTQVDYLFTRMFAFIRFVLKQTDRGG